MSIKDYNLLQSKENKKQIAIDFDGVIHKNSLGFHDGTVYDEPVDGSLDAVKSLVDSGFDVVVYTCKAKPDRPLINGKTGAELIWEWLEVHGFQNYIKSVTSEKPRAMFYIDDKAIKFANWKDTLTYIK